MTDFNTKLSDIAYDATHPSVKLCTRTPCAACNRMAEFKQAIIDLINKEVITHTHNNWCFLHCPYKSTEGVQIVEEQRNILKGGK